MTKANSSGVRACPMPMASVSERIGACDGRKLLMVDKLSSLFKSGYINLNNKKRSFLL